KDAALLRLQYAEGGGELHQRRHLVEADLQGKALGIFERTAADVLEPRRERDRRLDILLEGSLEGQAAELARLPVVVGQRRRNRLAVAEHQPRLQRGVARNRRGEAQI